MKVRMFAILVSACAVGCGKDNFADLANPDHGENEQELLPLRVAQDGWYLTENCILSLESVVYFRESDTGKFLFASSVTVSPTGRSGGSFTIRPTDKSLKDSFKDDLSGQSHERSIIKLHADAIPIPPETIGSQTEDLFLFGGEVVSKEVKKDTKIMPAQDAEVVDSQGTVVLRLPQ